MIAGHRTTADLATIADRPKTVDLATIADRPKTAAPAMIVALATTMALAMTVGPATIAVLADPAMIAVPAPAALPVVDARVIATLLVGFALTVTDSAWSSTEDALARFAEGRAAFEEESYSKARALMEQALAEGLDGPAVHYNIGAAAYRGGDLPRAEAAFREVARTQSMAALAYYNLGLVALQRRDSQDAREWFERSLQSYPDARLANLASHRLAELPESHAPGAWSYYSRGGFGYDDNVSLRSNSVESASTGQADSYGELILAGSYAFGAWRIDTGAGVVEYLDQDEYSQSSLSLGGSRSFRTDNWYFELGAYGSEYSLGGERFERNVTASGLVSRTFYGGGRLRASLRATSVKGNGAFWGLTGDRTDFGIYYDKSVRRWTFGAHVRSQLNDSEDPLFATRWLQLGGDLRYAASPAWGWVASAALRRTRHPAESEVFPGWDDTRATLLLGVTRMIRQRMQLFLRCQLERNDSPVAGYDYDRNWIAASVETWR